MKSLTKIHEATLKQHYLNMYVCSNLFVSDAGESRVGSKYQLEPGLDEDEQFDINMASAMSESLQGIY